jgi:heptosyltransferase I
LDSPRRILLIRPSALGDVARTVPVLVSLRRAYPAARIDWLVQASFADAVRAHPDLSGVVPFARPGPGRGGATAFAALLRRLRAGSYDLVLDAQGLARSGLMAWATGAPRRIGHADAREGAWLAYTRRVPADPEMHTVDRMLTLARAAGAAPVSGPATMRLYTPPDCRGFTASHPALAGRPYAVLAPTSRWPAKQWPDDRFAALACRLRDRGLAVALVGAAGERSQVPACLDVSARDPGVANLIGATSVGQLMDLIEHAQLVVGNDSAALHIAVGFQRPLVGLYGPTRVHRVGPYRHHADVIQHVRACDTMRHKDPSARALMERITLREVIEACLRRLG